MMFKKGLLKRIIIAGVSVITLCNLVVLYPRFADRKNELQPAPVAIIFGAGLTDTGEQTKMQFDRVEKGIDLYRSGLVQKIVITGDDGARWGNEVQAMKLQVLKAGVHEDDIIVDPHGYRTYDSCYRLKNLYEINNAIVVSQNFHLARIKYLCEKFGLKTQEVTADKQDYGVFWFKLQGREILARVKAVIDTYLFTPKVSLEK